MFHLKNKLTAFKEQIRIAENELFSDDRIEIISDRSLTVNGCRKIVEYGKESIVLRLRGVTVSVSGEDLRPESLINGEIAVRGKIKRVELDDKRTC